MKYTVTGEVLSIGKTKDINDKFSTREVVLEIGDKYPCPIPLDFCNKATELPDGVRVGDKVEVEFYLSGRNGKGQYADRVFLSLRATGLALIRDEPAKVEPPKRDEDKPAEKPEKQSDDLPF